jgi:hypothetical protein
MAKDTRVGLRLTDRLRYDLQRDADAAGLTLSEVVRRRLLATHPHVEALEDVERIKAAAHKAGLNADESLPHLRQIQQRLQEGLESLGELDAQAAQWREAAVREIDLALAALAEDMQRWRMDGIGQLMDRHLGREGARD